LRLSSELHRSHGRRTSFRHGRIFIGRCSPCVVYAKATCDPEVLTTCWCTFPSSDLSADLGRRVPGFPTDQPRYVRYRTESRVVFCAPSVARLKRMGKAAAGCGLMRQMDPCGRHPHRGWGPLLHSVGPGQPIGSALRLSVRPRTKRSGDVPIPSAVVSTCDDACFIPNRSASRDRSRVLRLVALTFRGR
jgi:hypothetical protein